MRLKFKWIFTLLMALSLQFSFAQEKTVAGVVSDATGPIPGVNVVVKGTKSGVQTDFDGKYSLKAKKGDVLVFTFIGMQQSEVVVGSSATVNVTLHQESKLLGEVVVLGYASRGKNQVTGNVKQITAEEVNGVPVVSIDQALQGKVAGLQISQASGTPGSVQDIRIRGVGSMGASNEPLYVIDGVPVINDNFSGYAASSSLSALSSISSKDVESMTILKDAAATSAYGARGSNGVIIITTKKGKSGKTAFDFNSSIGFQNDAIKGRQVLTGDQRKEVYLDGVYNQYGASQGFTRAGAEQWLFTNPLGMAVDNSLGKLKSWDGVSTNWGELVKNKNAVLRTFDFSASGGDEKTTFNMSLGYNDTEATVIGSEFKRITSKINFSRKLSENVKFSTNNSLASTKQSGILEGAGYFSNPYLTRYFMSPWFHAYNADGTLNVATLKTQTGLANTLYIMEHNLYENNLARIMSNNTLEAKIIDKLKFKSVLGIDYNLATFHGFNNAVMGDGAAHGGDAQQNITRNLNLVAQNSLNYSYSFRDHNFDATALFEYQKNTKNYQYGYGEGFAADGLTYLDNVASNKSVNGRFTDWLNVSYLGLLNYNYKGKYVLDFTYRREGSSKFNPGRRFGDFYAVGGAWNVTKEDFFDNTIFNELKLRGSIGTSGNNTISENKYQSLLAYDTSYIGSPTIYPSTYGNPLLQWEKNKNIDLGIDFGVLNNRISGSVAVYDKKTYDLLQNVPFSRTSGFSTITQNIGKMSNKGIEAELSFDILRSEGLNWNISGNLAVNDNKVTELAQDASGNDINITGSTTITKVGSAFNSWYLKKWAGVDPTNGAPQWFINGKDGNVTSDFNTAQAAIQGNSLPVRTGGFSTHFDYKGIYLDVSTYFATGGKIFDTYSFYTHSTGIYSYVFYNGVSDLINRWQKPGDITDVPKIELNATASNASRESTRFLYDDDYFRIKDLVLGYMFKKDFLNKIKLDALNLSVRGTNLFTFVKDGRLQYDPEARADGLIRISTPPVKSVTFAVNIKF